MIFHELEHVNGLSWVIQTALIAGLVLLAGGVLVRRRIATPDGGVLPDEGVTVRNVLEVLVEWLAEHGARAHGPEVAHVLPARRHDVLLHPDLEPDGPLPGLAGSTSDINTTAAWAIIAWVVLHGRSGSSSTSRSIS